MLEVYVLKYIPYLLKFSRESGIRKEFNLITVDSLYFDTP